MDNSTTKPEEEREEQKPEEQKKKSGLSTNLINRANSFQRNARSAKGKIDAFRGAKDAKKMLDMATDPQSALTSKIPGLGGKNGPLGKMPKELKNVRRIAQIASKIPPPVWIGIGIALAVVLLFFFIVTLIATISGGGGGSASLEGPSTLPPGSDGFSRVSGFQLFLNCSDEVLAPDGIAQCTISYTYDSTISTVPLENIVIHFELPQNTVFSSAVPTATTKDDITYSWPLSIPSNQTSLQIFFSNSQPDRFVDASAYITIVDGFTDTGLPTLDTCGGKYTLNNPVGNFGDPTCTYSNDQLYTLLQSQDPANAYDWYYKIAPCESSYIPVAYNPLAVDSAGAWGLFQMGRGLNGPYDHGDVPWQQQITNAIEYNKLITSSGIGPYWACAFE